MGDRVLKFGDIPTINMVFHMRNASTGAKKGEVKLAEFADRNAPIVAHPDEAAFGDYATIQSKYQTDREWVEFSALDETMIGQKVWLRGRVHTSRCKAAFGFVVLRRGLFTVQTVVLTSGDNAVSQDFLKFVAKVPPESVVDVFGEVVKGDVKSVSQGKIEVQATKFFVVSQSVPVLPFQLEDAARLGSYPVEEAKTEEAAPAEEEKGKGKKDKKKKKEEKPKAKKDQVILVGQDIRLDNRWLDLRTPANHAIFRLQARVCQYFREFFTNKGFVEIHTPKITPGVSEGGADVFKLDYFGEEACLAQSPQLYKQMAVESDLFNVFEIGHVFRAENSNTHRHMNEFMGLDFEMEIKEHYTEITTTLGDMLVHVFDQINKNCPAELAAVQRQYPFEPLAYKKETLRFPHSEAVKMLQEVGEKIGLEDDFSTPQEKKLGQLVKAKYGVDLYIVDQYPLAVRPFYTMPNAADKRFSNSYDVFLRGEEITSGAQRIHDVQLLKKRAEECEIPLSNIEAYLQSFQYGAYPHGGAGIGLERVVMLFLGLHNIRLTSMFPRTPNRLAP